MTKTTLFDPDDTDTLARIGFFYLQWVVKGGSVVDDYVAESLIDKYFHENYQTWETK